MLIDKNVRFSSDNYRNEVTSCRINPKPNNQKTEQPKNLSVFKPFEEFLIRNFFAVH